MLIPSESLIARLLPLWPELSVENRGKAVAEAVEFVRTEIRLAPAHIRIGICILSVLFQCFSASHLLYANLTGGNPAYEPFSPWERLGGPARSYTRLIRSLALLSYLENPLVLDGMHALTGIERQQQYRALRRKAIAMKAT